MRHNTFSKNHGKFLLKAIETAHELKHITPAQYKELKTGVEQAIKDKKKEEKA